MIVHCALCGEEINLLCDGGWNIERNLYVCDDCLIGARKEMIDAYLLEKINKVK